MKKSKPEPPAYVRDYLTSLDDHLAGGTLDDVRLAELLEVIGARHLKAEGAYHRLTAEQHEKAKGIAIQAIKGRGSLFTVGKMRWEEREGHLQATMATGGQG